MKYLTNSEVEYLGTNSDDLIATLAKEILFHRASAGAGRWEQEIKKKQEEDRIVCVFSGSAMDEALRKARKK